MNGINGPQRENAMFLKGIPCPEGLTATGDLAEALHGAALVLMVVPTPFVARTLG